MGMDQLAVPRNCCSPLLAVAVAMLWCAETAAQEPAGDVRFLNTFVVPDSLALTRTEQLVVGHDGTVYVLDANQANVLVFDPDGTFQRLIGRRGEGPGELLAPWRAGVIGDTLWVVDLRRPQINLYDAASGSSLNSVGPSTWSYLSGESSPLRPFALMSDGNVLAVRNSDREGFVEVLLYTLTEEGIAGPGNLLTVLDFGDRSIAVPIPGGGSGLRIRNPYSYSDMLFVASRGDRVLVVRRDAEEQEPTFTIEHLTVDGTTEVVVVPYESHGLDEDDVTDWLAGLSPLERMAEMGLFPSHTAAVEAAAGAFEIPPSYPPIANLGRGIVDEGLLMDSAGVIWFQRAGPGTSESREWTVLRSDESTRKVVVPRSLRVLAVRGNEVWAEVRDDFGIPSLRSYEVLLMGDH